MMGRREDGQGQFFYSFDLDKVVPPDHLARQIDGLLDLGLAGECMGVENIPPRELSRSPKFRCLPKRAMSVVGSRAENICSL